MTVGNSILRKSVSGVGFLAAGLLSVLDSTPAVEISRVGQWVSPSCGGVSAIAVSGTYAYLQSSLGLEVVDFSNPANPTVVGATVLLGGRPLKVEGSYAYAVFGIGDSLRVRVIDISSPASPRSAGATTNIAESVGGLAVSGNYAYLGADSGLKVIDISNPASPLLVGYTNVGGGARSVAVSGNYAYLGIGFRLQVFDVANPASPVPIGATNVSGSPESIAVSGNYAYVTVGASLQVIDISNPANPSRVASTNTLNSVNDIALSGPYAYLTTGSGLEVFDIGNPASPVRLAASPYQDAFGVGISGNYAVLGGSGVQVLDISSPANPITVGRLPASASTLGVAQSGNYAYLADEYAGLQVINISKPASPVRVGGYHDYNKPSSPFEVAVSGARACMLDYTNGLQVFDVSNPTNPALLGICAITNLPRRLTVSGNYAYVTMERKGPAIGAGMTLIDLTIPTNPVIAATYWVTNPPHYGLYMSAGAVAVSNNYAYLTCGGNWWDPEFGETSLGTFEVVNVSNPTNPSYAGRASDFWYEGWDVALSGTHAYAVYYWRPRPPTYPTGLGGLVPINITNPNNPVGVWRTTNGWSVGFETGQKHSQVAISGNYACLLGGAPDLRVIDISDPTNMVQLASTNTGANRIAVSDHYLYAASGSQGLQIFCLDCPRLSAGLVGGQVLLSWPASASDYVLESASSLSGAQWQPVPGTPQLSNNFYQLSVPAIAPAEFFRLRRP